MPRQIRAMMVPHLEVAIQPNHITVRNQDSGQVATMTAPFSCGHLIADDVDILEHAASQLFRRTTTGFWFRFPRVNVSISGRVVHNVERKVISDALMNAGASRVTFDPTIHKCDEQSTAQSAYVEIAMRNR